MRGRPWSGLRLLGLLSITLLQGCETTPTTAIPEQCVPCEVLEIVTFSGRDDTAETVRQVREQNAVIKELCP